MTGIKTSSLPTRGNSKNCCHQLTQQALWPYWSYPYSVRRNAS